MKKKYSFYRILFFSIYLFFFFSPVLRAYETEYYDVVVMGTEPEGIVAAVAAARAGGKTLLIEGEEGFGGTMIAARLNSIDMNYGPQGEILTQGIFLDFFKAMGGDSFDVQEGKMYFHNLIQKEENLTLIKAKSWDVFSPKDRLIQSISIFDGEEVRIIYGERFIDATGDAELAARAGVPYRIGKEDLGYDAQMSVTLVFEIEGVDWSKVMSYLNHDGNPDSGANQRSAWGFTPFVSNYETRDKNLMLRGLNIGRQKDGTVLINGLLIFGVNALDPASREEGKARAKEEIDYILPFLQEKVPGFERAALSGYASHLYIRESRYIEGLYRLHINDVLGHTMFWDRIALGSYPIDQHPTYVGHWGVILGRPAVYSIPLRCLIPINIENLLVVGRSASFSSLAAGSARVIPIGMAMGESAGIASIHSLNVGLNFHEIIKVREEVEKIQSLIVKAGGNLTEYRIPDPHASHWAYPYIRVLRSSGHLAGGYTNQLQLDNKITHRSFVNLMNVSLYTLTREVVALESHPFSLPAGDVLLTGRDAAYYLLSAYNIYKEPSIEVVSLDNLVKAGIVSSQVRGRITEDAVLTRAEAFALLADLITAIRDG